MTAACLLCGEVFKADRPAVSDEAARAQLEFLDLADGMRHHIATRHKHIGSELGLVLGVVGRYLSSLALVSSDGKVEEQRLAAKKALLAMLENCRIKEERVKLAADVPPVPPSPLVRLQ